MPPVGRILLASGCGPGTGSCLVLAYDPELGDVLDVETRSQVELVAPSAGGIWVYVVTAPSANTPTLGQHLITLSHRAATDVEIAAARCREFALTRNRERELAMLFERFLDRASVRLWREDSRAARACFLMSTSVFSLETWPLELIPAFPLGRPLKYRDATVAQLARACAHLGLVVDLELLTGGGPMSGPGQP